jgi:hypothetical protein
MVGFAVKEGGAMWVILVVEAAMVWFAWAYLEIMYANNYYCQTIPYANGDVEVQCWYLP